jgi:hypothetical protein
MKSISGCLDVLRGLEYFRVLLDGVAIVGHWKSKQKRAWKDQGMAICQDQLTAMNLCTGLSQGDKCSRNPAYDPGEP